MLCTLIIQCDRVIVSLSNKGGYGNENSKKGIGFMSIHVHVRTFWTHIMLFVHFSAVPEHEHREKISFSFSKLRYRPLGLSTRKIC